MRSITALAAIIAITSITTGHALDLDQLRARDRRMLQPAPQPATQQQDSQTFATAKDRQDRQRDESRPLDTFTVRNQLPQVESVSIDRLKAQLGGFQPDTPAEYQYQPLQTLGTQQIDSNQTEDAKPEKPVEEEQNEQIVEAMVEAEPQAMEETTGEEQLVSHAIEGNIEYRIIEENNSFVVLQVEATNNRQTQ